MGFFDALWHAANLLFPALGLALFLSLWVKLLWWRRVSGALWWSLVQNITLTGVLVVLGFWLVLGRDGTVAMYATLVASAAGVTWWSAFRGRA